MLKSSGLLVYSLWIIIALSSLIGIFANFTNFCEIYDSELNYTFDLNKSIVDNKDVVIIPKVDNKDVVIIPKNSIYNDTMRMQLCTPLMEKCNDEDGFAICLRYENGTEKGIGKFPPEVSNKNGLITFLFPGTVCKTYRRKKNKNYILKVFVRCDYATYYSRPILEYFTRHSCKINLLWKTALVCGPRTYSECTTTHNNEHYDLTSLIRYSKNYIIRTESEISAKLVLNICHSVIREPTVVCPTNAGACIYNKKLKRYINLGNIQSSPVFTNEYLLLEYKNGDLCDVRNKTSETFLRYRTTIRFICSLEATNTIPEYAGKDKDCHYQVIWYTRTACSREALLEYENYRNDCTILNPLTKSTYNLRPLMNLDYNIQHNGARYLISVCRPLMNNLTCKSGTGICDMQYHMSLGEANSELMWEQGGPYLYYINGSYCGLNEQFITAIAFFCGPEKLSYQPFIVEEGDCFMIIYWNTNLVCDKKVECITDDDDEINLTPLIRHKKNYIVKYKHIEFHINICRSLVPTTTLMCEHGSAACMAQLELNNKYIHEVSLGYPLHRPTLNDKQQIILRYDSRSQCETNRYKQLSTNITFLCGNEVQGHPTYIGYIDCTYIFTWNTRLACKTIIGTWIPPCTVINTVFKDEYDLSILYEIEQMHYVKGKLGKEYSINICNKENYCNGSAVCDETNDYGSLTNIVFNYKQRNLKLEYSNGSTCSSDNDSYTSIIRLICNKSMGIGIPKLLLESECNVQFEWETGIICTKEIDLENIEEEESNDDQKMTSEDTEEFFSDRGMNIVTTITGIILFVITMLILTICYENRYWLKKYISTCYRRCFNLNVSTNSVTYMTQRNDNET